MEWKPTTKCDKCTTNPCKSCKKPFFKGYAINFVIKKPKFPMYPSTQHPYALDEKFSVEV